MTRLTSKHIAICGAVIVFAGAAVIAGANVGVLSFLLRDPVPRLA